MTNSAHRRVALTLLLVALAWTARVNGIESPRRIADRVKAVVAEVLGVADERVTLETNLRKDLGARETDVKEILMKLEDEFKVELPVEEPATVVTVGDVVRLVQNSAGDPN